MTSDSSTSVPSYRLNDGHHLPAIGLGTWQIRGPAGVDSVVSALHAGYRLIDSAFNYENEGAVGEAVRRARVPRDELVITSKLAGRHHARAKALTSVHESVYRMGLDHLDLLLIHWPNPLEDLYVEAWQALVDLQRKGVLRSIGVSNFLPEHLDRIIEATGVTPAVNQIELHPYWPQPDQLAADAARGIRTESWSPIGRGNPVREEPAVAAIAQAHGRTPTQIILRWHVQLGAVPLPKAAGIARQKENLAIFDFELTDEEMAEISALARPDGRIADQDPAVHQEF